MNRSFILTTACVLAGSLLACGSDERYQPEFTQREASTRECVAGGTVISVDGKEQAVLCNGQNGLNGLNGLDGSDGRNGVNGTNGTNGSNASLPGLVTESVFCTASTEDPDPFRSVSYKHARLFDGSLFVTVSCDTDFDQDTSAELFSVAQEGASSGFMRCSLADPEDDIINFEFTPNFLTRSLVVTENEVVVVDQVFDEDCTVVTGS